MLTLFASSKALNFSFFMVFYLVTCLSHKVSKIGSKISKMGSKVSSVSRRDLPEMIFINAHRTQTCCIESRCLYNQGAQWQISETSVEATSAY